LLGAGKTLWQLNPHFGVQVLLKVKKRLHLWLVHGTRIRDEGDRDRDSYNDGFSWSSR